MSQPPQQGATAPPEIIYIIRHGEKPADPPVVAPGQTPPASAPPFGVDSQGNENPHSLLPRGWQRSGALAVLFDPATGPLQAGLQTPAALLSPSYGSADKTAEHRTYQTIEGLSDRLGLAIVSSLVTAHGGVASVRTAPGRGATFRVALPLAPEAQGGLPPEDDDDDQFDQVDQHPVDEADGLSVTYGTSSAESNTASANAG